MPKFFLLSSEDIAIWGDADFKVSFPSSISESELPIVLDVLKRKGRKVMCFAITSGWSKATEQGEELPKNQEI